MATDITRLPPPDLAEFRNRTIGFVFQFHHLLPEFSALENAMMPALIAGRRRGEAENAARELLDAVGMSHRLEHESRNPPRLDPGHFASSRRAFRYCF